MKLTKFPVTSSDGTEYRVTITEFEADHHTGAYVRVRLYTERKGRRFFRFKASAPYDYYEGEGVYFPVRPDYVALAKQAVSDYEEYIVWLAKHRAEKAAERTEQARHKSAAVTAFTKWDGVITNNKTEVSE